MNIQEAKETIEKALRAYFARDEIGFPLVPLRQQRPILLIGPPGIGKTAIMEQIAEECGVGLVAYTMTHHTRQSAMGLPEICTRGIEGKMVHTTEYTMSEIIASIYDCMEQTGKKRGILFLDEINCVSETLAPVMLQLLQDKKFGNQHIPDDWLIVAAGNPPEYNKSVREFDVATLDRVRKIEVLPELSVWLSYAEKNQIHSAVTTYLMAHSDHFYSVSQEADEKRFVTARGWEDLSAVLKSYEILHFPVDEALIGQYLQEEKTAEEFSSYYRIYEKYGQDYGVEEILAGALSGKIMAEKQKMAANGSAEERSVLLSLFHAALQKEASGCQKQEHTAKELSECFRQFTGLCRQKKDETYAYRIELMANQIKVLFGEVPDNLEDFACMSQISQAEAKKYFIERFRIGKWRRTGIIWWNVIDGCPQFSDAVVDYYYNKKMAYYYIKRSQARTALIFDEPAGHNVQLYGVNDYGIDKDIKFKVTDVITDRIIYEGETSLPADSSVVIASVDASEHHAFFLLEWTCDGKKFKNHYVLWNPPFNKDLYMECIRKAGLQSV